MFVLAVWIPVWMFMNYGVHMKFLSWIKNSPKTWNIAVNLTEVSSLKTGIKLLIILLIMFFLQFQVVHMMDVSSYSFI